MVIMIFSAQPVLTQALQSKCVSHSHAIPKILPAAQWIEDLFCGENNRAGIVTSVAYGRHDMGQLLCV